MRSTPGRDRSVPALAWSPQVIIQDRAAEDSGGMSVIVILLGSRSGDSPFPLCLCSGLSEVNAVCGVELSMPSGAGKRDGENRASRPLQVGRRENGEAGNGPVDGSAVASRFAPLRSPTAKWSGAVVRNAWVCWSSADRVKSVLSRRAHCLPRPLTSLDLASPPFLTITDLMPLSFAHLTGFRRGLSSGWSADIPVRPRRERSVGGHVPKQRVACATGTT